MVSSVQMRNHILWPVAWPLDHRPLSRHFAALLLALAATPCTTSQQPAGRSGYTNVSANQPLVLIVVVLVCFALFAGCFYIFVHHCTDTNATQNSRRPSNTAAGGRLQWRWSPRGLHPSVIDSFPIFVYSVVKDLKIGKEALQCAVCITDFVDDEALRLLPECGHVFHPECIDAWLAFHSTCPVCRHCLIPHPGELSEDIAHRVEFDASPDEQNLRAEQSNSVCVDVAEDQRPHSRVDEDANGCETPTPNRLLGVERFPRSHSTGRSLTRSVGSTDRYTLRLPEEIRKQMVIERLKGRTGSARQ